MCWNIYFVLLSFASLPMKGNTQLADNTPPSVWLADRNWNLRENETVGTKISQAHGDDTDDEVLTYSLEPISFDGKYVRLPFRIDNETGTVYLNESLVGRAGENLHLYVQVNDGKLEAKTEVNVNILAANSRFNPSRPLRPPSNGIINYPGMIHRSGQHPPILNYPNGNHQSVINYSPFIPNPPYFSDIRNPSTNDMKSTNKTTILKPVLVKHDEIDNSISEKTKETTTTTAKMITKTFLQDDIESTNELLTSDLPIRSTETLSGTIIPIAAVIGVFLTIGGIAFVFGKKIYNSKEGDGKDDIRKEFPNGTVVQEDPGVNLQEWRRPRASSNRYEAWNLDAGRIPIGNQLSTSDNDTDRWEFPRHRLKFFNILGEGAFGQVWKCEAIDLNGKDTGVTVVAVKTLKENANEKEKSDLLSELQVMKMLEPHANVVRLLGCCTDKEPIFLIMEYISKGKLQGYLRNSRAERYYNNMHGPSRSLTSRDLTSFVYQVAKGMEFLSENGIIHRDLAARNILITEDHVCKVADFGFARDIIANHIYERKSEGRLPIRWMAPESLYDNIFTIKSDVWSFGVLVWEVVTLGSTPYPGISAVEVMKKVRDGFRLDKPEHCRRELYNIMYYCWDKDPKERPSFTELAELLEKLLLTETDYIELERFPDHSYYNMMSLSGEKL
ncbi:tyrosine kinase receptor Cad96Ca [Diorhabda carinulata]|uniref:tyrosine kinase receptor Cad96Ca n=1 Tax=Diorhabda carinulata TaxID=1163345 RepID=UPI0025A07141|nr:tyrosine kinase receptor Cad96Ca [Diorhabda carinulata]